MKTKILIALFILVPFIFTTTALADPALPPRGSDSTTESGQALVFDGEGSLLRRNPDVSFTGIGMYSTNWFAEADKYFKAVKRYPSGTKFKAVAPGDFWVDLTIPVPYTIEGAVKEVDYVEFCARSSNGAKTKPKYVEVWSEEAKIANKPFIWNPNNNQQCIGVAISPAQRVFNLAVAVELKFKNTTDKIWMNGVFATFVDEP